MSSPAYRRRRKREEEVEEKKKREEQIKYYDDYGSQNKKQLPHLVDEAWEIDEQIGKPSFRS